MSHMYTQKAYFFPPSCLVVMAISALVGSHAHARQLLPGETVVISNPSPAETWSAGGASSLTINGGSTLSISANGASSVVLNGVSTSGSSGPSAVQIINSTAEINSSMITGNRTGLNVARVSGTSSGSVVSATDSSISGLNGGVIVSSYSTFNLSGTQVSGIGGTGFGIALAGGSANASNNSTIAGVQNGVVFRADPTDTQSSNFTLNQSHVRSSNGAAILVDVPSISGSTVNIDVQNGSSIIGGNGVILDVRGGASATMNVDRSSLSGDIVSDSLSSAHVILNDEATVNGRMVNVANVSINDSGRWNVTGQSDIGALELNGGTVSLQSAAGFYQLNIASLTGNEGNFLLKTDFTTGQTDIINIVGDASGSHNIEVASSGLDAPAGEPITLVRTGGGNAQFRLSNGSVDLGAFRYELASSGNDWFLDPTTRTISPGARSVLALFNTAIPVWYGDMAPLHTRLSELRSSDRNAGGWGRAYGKKYNVADGSGVGYQQTQQGFSLGWDMPLSSFADGQWMVGVLAGHSNSDLNLDYGTSGTIESNYFGVYATWMDRTRGYYLDGVLKYNSYRNKAKVSLSDGARVKGNNNNSGIGWESEFGRHIMLSEKTFIEPFAKLSAVYIKSEDFVLDNGMDAQGDAARSLLGGIGMRVGHTFNLKKDVFLQPYVKSTVEHEFAKNNQVKVNNNVFNNDLSGTRVAWGAGLAVSMSKSLQGHAEFDYINGKNFEQPYGFSVGLRYMW